MSWSMTSSVNLEDQDKDADDKVAFDTASQRIAAAIIFYKWSDQILGLIIMCNTIVMILETNQSADESPDSGVQWTQIFGIGILTIFAVELVLRIMVHRMEFWSDPWNLFDFIVVSTDTVFTILGPILGSIFPVSILRIFRLSKLARISKLLRVFPELRLLIAGLMGSISAIFWGTILLAFVLLVWALVAVNIIHPVNKEIVYENCDRCTRAFGSVEAAILTFTQQIVTGDSWGQVTIPIIESQPLTAIFFALVYLSTGMGVLNLIVGVVVNVFTRAHDSLREEAQHEVRLMKMGAQRQILSVCQHMDTDHLGYITKEELIKGFENDEILRQSLKELEIAEEDLQVLRIILDPEQSGKVSYREFAISVYKMRSSDSHFMLAYIKYYITLIKNAILGELASHQRQLDSVSRTVSSKIDNASKLVEEEEQLLLDVVGQSKKYHVAETTTKVSNIESPLADAVRSCHPKQDTDMQFDLQRFDVREDKASSSSPADLIQEKDTNLVAPRADGTRRIT